MRVLSLINGREASSDGGWLTLPEAAARLGVAVITLRRRLKEGAFEAKQTPGPHGPQWMIRLESDQVAATKVIVAAHQVDQAEQAVREESDQAEQGQNDQADKPEQGGGDQAALLEALRMMRSLQEENRTLAGQVGFLQAQLLQSQAQLGEAQQTIKMLEAPKVEVVEQGSEESAKPWWRFW
jgi:hypothetical protein